MRTFPNRCRWCWGSQQTCQSPESARESFPPTLLKKSLQKGGFVEDSPKNLSVNSFFLTVKHLFKEPFSTLMERKGSMDVKGTSRNHWCQWSRQIFFLCTRSFWLYFCHQVLKHKLPNCAFASTYTAALTLFEEWLSLMQFFLYLPWYCFGFLDMHQK